jgi:hypothetical protein
VRDTTTLDAEIDKTIAHYLAAQAGAKNTKESGE